MLYFNSFIFIENFSIRDICNYFGMEVICDEAYYPPPEENT